jgi:2-keto-4-pentenoate hydratase/2-oxohepta-3-ene-1,7-dioic acid hydratase in catechol pathway
MKLCRFDDATLGHDRLGVVEGDSILDVTPVLEALPALRWPLPKGDPLIANLPALLPKIAAAAKSAPRKARSAVKLKSPVANPSHVIAAPLNYKLHVEESKDPAIHHGVHLPTHEGFATPIDKMGLFLKSQTGLVGESDGIQIHWPDRRNDHELELAVVIGTGGKAIARADAMKHVAGYGIGLDITVRGPEDRSYRKSADSYSVLGPWLVTADEIAAPGALDMEITVDGVTRQKSNTRELICDIPDLIVRASRVYALHPGDIILTGTPDGVSEIKAGNTLACTIAQIGTMTITVR